MNWFKSIRSRWFNIPSSTKAIPITTKKGSRYWINLDEDQPFQIIVFQNAKSCGLIRMIWNMEQLELGDFFIWENHRNKGLGTALLQWLIKYARQQNCSRISGIVSPEKASDFNWVMDWYQRQGFQREPLDSRVIIYDLTEFPRTG